MTRIRIVSFALLSTATLALLATACGTGDPEPQASPRAATGAEAPGPGGASEGVAYEPAFPEDVSAEGLSEADVAQQEATHSHGGEEHTHGEGGHADGDDTHTHGDGASHDDHEH